jgi:phage/plasmid primase-like uncharacterized protein
LTTAVKMGTATLTESGPIKVADGTCSSLSSSNWLSLTLATCRLLPPQVIIIHDHVEIENSGNNGDCNINSG